jgi:hypothetical protein
MRLHVLALALVVCAFTSRPAHADLITVSSTFFDLGVDVSHAFEGITLQRLEQNSILGPHTYAPVALPVITAEPFQLPLDVTFGAYDGGFGGYNRCFLSGQGGVESPDCSVYFSVLEVTFDAPTNSVQIVGDFNPGLEPNFHAYTGDGSFLGTCGPYQALSGLGCVVDIVQLQPDLPYVVSQGRSTLSFTSDRPDIARVVWGGFSGGAWAHRISYTVPEPSTLLLAGIGAVGLVSRRKRFSISSRNTEENARG